VRGCGGCCGGLEMGRGNCVGLESAVMEIVSDGADFGFACAGLVYRKWSWCWGFRAEGHT
jgi:hypothetical protein